MTAPSSQQRGEAPLPDAVAQRAHMALFYGGLGLRSAFDHAPASFASWAGVLGPMSARDPGLCAAVTTHLVAPLPHPLQLAWCSAPPARSRLETPAVDFLCKQSPHCPANIARSALGFCAFRALLLRLPLPLDAASCRCRRPFDACGDHRAACPRSDFLRLQGAGSAMELAPRSQSTNFVSPLDSAGALKRHQRCTQHTAFRGARQANERTYPELLHFPRCRLVVLAIELGGRWSEETVQFVRLLARQPSIIANARPGGCGRTRPRSQRCPR